MKLPRGVEIRREAPHGRDQELWQLTANRRVETAYFRFLNSQGVELVRYEFFGSNHSVAIGEGLNPILDRYNKLLQEQEFRKKHLSENLHEAAGVIPTRTLRWSNSCTRTPDRKLLLLYGTIRFQIIIAENFRSKIKWLRCKSNRSSKN